MTILNFTERALGKPSSAVLVPPDLDGIEVSPSFLVTLLFSAGGLMAAFVGVVLGAIAGLRWVGGHL